VSVLFEVLGQRGKLQVVEDPEVGHIYAVVPHSGKISPATLKEVKELTLDPWRYVDGVGLVLDITAWKQEADISPEEIRNRIEGKYKELVDEVAKLLEEGSKTSSAQKKRKKKRKSRKSKTKKKRSRR